jgi:hypothetical protein
LKCLPLRHPDAAIPADTVTLPKNLDRGPELWTQIEYQQGEQLASDSVYARWVAHAQKLLSATRSERSERQLPDNRTCVLLCGGR